MKRHMAGRWKHLLLSLRIGFCYCCLAVVPIANSWVAGAVAVANHKRYSCSSLKGSVVFVERDDDDDDDDGGGKNDCASPLYQHDVEEEQQRNTYEDWEEMARVLSTVALEEVLSSSSHNTAGSLTAEKSLQRTLRSIHTEDASSSIKMSAEKRQWLRRRIKELVLGTSIFRLRHQYVQNKTSTSTDHDDAGEANHANRTRDFVNLHADFLLEQVNEDHDDKDDRLPNNLPWPVDPVERISVRYSMPRFLVQLWINEHGVHETEAICRVCNEPGPMTLRRNKVACSSDDVLVKQLEQEGFQIKPLADVFIHDDKSRLAWRPPSGCIRVSSRPANKSIWSLSTWQDGCFELQDVGSQLIVMAAEATPGETVIDFCAGNGGKTLSLASELHSVDGTTDSRVIAHDVVAERLAQIRGSLARARLEDSSSVKVVTTMDCEKALSGSKADVVLVDAPCSSCGVLRRRPSQRWVLTETEMRDTFPILQASILERAAQLVKPGGKLVYATCSISAWENQDVVEKWEESSDFKEYGYEPWYFEEGWPHQENVRQHCRQLLPHKHDSDGFFIARWKRG